MQTKVSITEYQQKPYIRNILNSFAIAEELTFLERVYINHLHQGKIPIAQEKNNTENTTKTQEKKIGEQKKTQKRRNSSENKEESPTKTTKRRARVMKDEKVKDEDVGPAKRPRRSRKKSTETDS